MIFALQRCIVGEKLSHCNGARENENYRGFPVDCLVRLIIMTFIRTALAHTMRLQENIRASFSSLKNP